MEGGFARSTSEMSAKKASDSAHKLAAFPGGLFKGSNPSPPLPLGGLPVAAVLEGCDVARRTASGRCWPWGGKAKERTERPKVENEHKKLW